MLQRIALFHFRLNKSILQELWIFFACIYTKKISTTANYSDLENRMSLASRTSMPLQCDLTYSACSTEWVDVYYKHICGNILIIITEPFIHV